jgi:O-antigen ligase
VGKKSEMHLKSPAFTNDLRVPALTGTRLIRSYAKISLPGLSSTMKNRNIMPYLIAIWLQGTLIVNNVAPTDSSKRIFLAVALAWIFVILFLKKGRKIILGPVWYERPYLLFTLLAFFSVTFPVAFYSIDPGVSLGHWAVTVVGFVICASLWYFLDSGNPISLEIYAVLGISLIVVAGICGYSGGRFGILAGPNAVGLVLLSLITCSFVIHIKLLKYGCLLAGGFVLFLTNSRSSIIGTMIAALVFGLFHSRQLGGRQRLLIFVVVPIMIALLVYFDYVRVIANYIVEEVMRMHDPTRGIGVYRGFIRRVMVWEETVEVWLSHPFIGVGYRLHEHYVFLASSAHNGYLALLSETGIFGVIPVVVLIMDGGYRLFRRSLEGVRIAQIGFAIFCGYLFVCFFERFLVNFGNPTSILFVIFLLMPTRGRCEKRKISS